MTGSNCVSSDRIHTYCKPPETYDKCQLLPTAVGGDTLGDWLKPVPICRLTPSPTSGEPTPSLLPFPLVHTSHGDSPYRPPRHTVLYWQALDCVITSPMPSMAEFRRYFSLHSLGP
jgi:hypothetical protein